MDWVLEDNQELLLTLLIYYVLSKETRKGKELLSVRNES